MEITCVTHTFQKLDLVEYILRNLKHGPNFMCLLMESWLDLRDYNEIQDLLSKMEDEFETDDIVKSLEYADSSCVSTRITYDFSIIICSLLLPELLKYRPAIPHYSGGWFDLFNSEKRVEILELVKKELLGLKSNL